MPKLITVFCATGGQGNSVVKALACDAANYTVRAATRDPDCPGAQQLKALGAELVRVDCDNPDTIGQSLQGAYGAFVTTFSDHTDKGYLREIQQGKNIADACAREGVEHVVFNTKLSVVKVVGVNVRHMDAKYEIETYMRSMDLPVTSIIVPCLYEDLMGVFRPLKSDDQAYELTIPMGPARLDLMSLQDLGDVVREIFNQRNQHLHKTLSLSAAKITLKEMARCMQNALPPKTFKDKQMTIVQFRDMMNKLHKETKLGEDLAYMFDFFIRVDQKCSIDMTKRLHPSLSGFEHWLMCNADQVNKALDFPKPEEPYFIAG